MKTPIPRENLPLTQPLEITERRVLFVEGKDEEIFFSTLLEHMHARGWQVEPYGGRDQFNTTLPAFQLRPGYENVEVLAIVRDANTQGIASSLQSIIGTCQRNNLTPPSANAAVSNGKPRVGIFIIDDGSGNGMLEDLCLQTVRTHPAMPCVQGFADCTSGLPEPPKNPSKAKSQVFLAALPDIVNSVGLAATKGYWDLEFSTLAPLKSFLSACGT